MTSSVTNRPDDTGLRALADHAARLAAREMRPAERARFAMSLRSHNPLRAWHAPTDRRGCRGRAVAQRPRERRPRSRARRAARRGSTRAGPGDPDPDPPSRRAAREVVA